MLFAKLFQTTKLEGEEGGEGGDLDEFGGEIPKVLDCGPSGNNCHLHQGGDYY
eukprot:CAMPEP_0184329266 /NCGR_PEP_ID=MMETSP1049-20130417/144058_1 /TAXON_ID=77928 /ORGANISM="Proteomonas sulcata, Strain CCMP704" /LENGTH=52 /DNA_ID=CAMNT_0026651621 /DNA_START=487 /DNA_END=645 /DNA_ORIENTATION=+